MGDNLNMHINSFNIFKSINFDLCKKIFVLGFRVLFIDFLYKLIIFLKLISKFDSNYKWDKNIRFVY